MTRSLAFAAIVFAAVIACASPAQRKLEHVERGQAYYDSGDYARAILEFKNVLQLDPRDAAARSQLARAYVATGDAPSLQSARYHLGIAVDGDAPSLDLRLDLAGLDLMFGENEQALKQASESLKLAPSDPKATLLRGRAHLALGDLESAGPDLRQAIQLAPKSAEARVWLAELQLLSGDYGAARASIDEALALDPNAFRAYLLLGDIHLLGKEYLASENAYKRARDIAKDDSATFLKLAAFYRSLERWEDAEEVYKQFAQTKPSEPDPLVALAHLHRRTGDADKEVATLKTALALDPRSQAVRDQLLGAQLRAGNVDAMHAELSSLAEQRADDPIVSYYEAQLQIRQRNFDEGIRLLRLLVARDTKSSAPRIALGKALLATGDRPAAIAVLKETTSVSPVSTEASVMLSELYLADGELELAIAESRKAYQRDKQSHVAVGAYGNALLRAGELSKAEDLFTKAASESPNSATLQWKLGLVAKAQHKPEQALAHFNAALERAPQFAMALSEIVHLILEQGAPEQALARVQQQLLLRPKQAEFHDLLGSIHSSMKQWDLAAAAYKQSIKLAGDVSDACLHLVVMYGNTGRSDAARKEFSDLAAKEPKNVGAHVLVGLLAHRAQDLVSAQTHYQAALRLNPHVSVAANNLATILAEDGQHLDRALTMAKLAYSLRPGDTNVLDTLGWIYYKRKDFSRAQALLTAAARRAPSDAEVQYHYGMVLAVSNGQRDKARARLEGVATMDPAFAHRVKLQETLATLN